MAVYKTITIDDLDHRYIEPTEDEIVAYLRENALDYNRNWWHARETLRNQKNSIPPYGYSDWGMYWKTR